MKMKIRIVDTNLIISYLFKKLNLIIEVPEKRKKSIEIAIAKLVFFKSRGSLKISSSTIGANITTIIKVNFPNELLLFLFDNWSSLKIDSIPKIETSNLSVISIKKPVARIHAKHKK
jgi:hypothetical protein